MAGRIAVVDLADRFVRWEERRRVHEERLVHRSVHVLLLDSRGRLVVQKRHRTKQTHPGAWDSSCAGHVEESDYPRGPDDDLDRVYRDVAARELEEELAVRPGDLREAAHLAPVDEVHYEQVRLFLATSDGPYVPQPDEVEEVRAVTRAGLAALAGREPVTPMLLWLALAHPPPGWR